MDDVESENVKYYSLPEDTLYWTDEAIALLPKGDVMELPTVYLSKEQK